MPPDERVVLITGTRKGIGKYLVEHYAQRGFHVVGCSRRPVEYEVPGYRHYTLDVADEVAAKNMFVELRKVYGRLDVLINNAGIASMNAFVLTPLTTAESILKTNVLGTFLFCREAAKLMRRTGWGRIVNLVTIAVPLKLEGESIYVASKSAVIGLTQVIARELADFGITVNAVGPAPIMTDLVRSVPEEKIEALLQRLAIHRLGEFSDVANVVDFLIQPTSSAVTGQTIFLGGA